MKLERLTRGDNVDYMWRLHIFTCRWLKIYLHIFVSSDDECLHDHPWDFVSIILWGGYWEVTPEGKKFYGPGSILRRRADHAHQVIVDKPACTLVFTKRKSREWGFWTKTKLWIHWRDYNHKEYCTE